MKFSFHGAAGMVTGSNYLIETEKAKVLVDCGMFQGSRKDERRNMEGFQYNPAEIDAVVLTHAHLDHTGRLPILYRDGFRGTIYGTHPTLDLAKIVIDDSIHIQRERAKRSGEKMMFNEEELQVCWTCTKGARYGEELVVAPGVRVVYRDAGHIMGSGIVELWVREDGKETKFVFSGDLGNNPTPFLAPTDTIAAADYVICESTYGDRLHEHRDERREKLRDAVEKSIAAGGTLMIPAFAIERSQEILFELNAMVESKQLPEVPMFLDSPMAIRATRVYQEHAKHLGEHFSERAVKKLTMGDKLFDFPGLEFTMETEESKAINDVSSPKVIIAGSGMSTGGRILHHEKRYLPDPKATLLIIGYQVRGTLGRRILDGSSSVKIWGEEIPVRANVRAIGGYSAHADQNGLITWLGGFSGRKPQHVFVTHGEPGPAAALVEKIKGDLELEAHAPKLYEEVIL